MDLDIQTMVHFEKVDCSVLVLRVVTWGGKMLSFMGF